jgi:hypothetical protein
MKISRRSVTNSLSRLCGSIGALWWPLRAACAVVLFFKHNSVRPEVKWFVRRTRTSDYNTLSEIVGCSEQLSLTIAHHRFAAMGIRH